MTATYEDRPGSYWRPIAVDGRVDFIEVHTAELAEEADWIFRVQWDYVHGYVTTSELEALPESFQGVSVVRTARELDDLARRFEFDIDTIYRELFS